MALLYQAALLALTQLATSDPFRGRVFTLRGAVMSGCMMAGTGVAALTVGRFDVVTALSVQTLAPILAGPAALALLRPGVIPGPSE